MLLIATALSGCVTAEELDQRASVWIGQDADAIATAWGAPSGTYLRKDGSKILTYTRASVVTTGSEPYMQATTRHCRIDVVIDADGKILSVSWHGAVDQCDRDMR